MHMHSFESIIGNFIGYIIPCLFVLLDMTYLEMQTYIPEMPPSAANECGLFIDNGRLYLLK